MVSSHVWRPLIILVLFLSNIAIAIALAKPTYQSCSDSQIRAFEDALEDARSITDLANSTLHMLRGNGPPRGTSMIEYSNVQWIFKRWFGREAMFERDYILGVFERMHRTLSLDGALRVQCEHLPLRHYKCHSDWADEIYQRYEWTYAGENYRKPTTPLVMDRRKENTTHICPCTFELRRTIDPVRGGINRAKGRVHDGLVVEVPGYPFMSMPMVIIESMAQMIPISAPRRITGILHPFLRTSIEGLDRLNEKGPTYHTHWIAWQGHTRIAAHNARSYSHFAVDLMLARRGYAEMGREVRLKWRDGFEEKRANVGEVRGLLRELEGMDGEVERWMVEEEC